MKNIFFIILFTLISQKKKIDINGATLEELKKLPIPEEVAESIFVYRNRIGYFQNVFELMNVPSMKAEYFKKIKPLVFVKPLIWKRLFSYEVERVKERMAAEERPTEMALETWIEKLYEPLNIHKASLEEIRNFWGVSLIDALAIIKYRKLLKYKRFSHLRQTPFLTYYAYRNLRPFITFYDRKPPEILAYFNFKIYYYSPLYLSDSDLADMIEELSQEDSTLWNNLENIGWTEQEIEDLKNKLKKQQEEFNSLEPKPSYRIKSRIKIKGKYLLGLYYENSIWKKFSKAFFGFENIKPIRKIIFGNYRISLNQGLLIDNTDFISDRTYQKATGIYGDLTGTYHFKLFGLASELEFDKINVIGFFSDDKKNALTDINGNPIFYYNGTFTPTCYKEKLEERIYGVNLTIKNIYLNWLSFGFMQIDYPDKKPSLNFDYLDKPFDSDSLKGRSFYWVNEKRKTFFSIALKGGILPFGWDIEYAFEKGGKGAFILFSRYQRDFFHINFIYRNYSPSYTNPYMRTFSEDYRFEDTPMEKPYRLIEPLANSLERFPMPKPEEGFFLDMRYQFLRNVIIPRAYIDIWKDKTDGLWCHRAQAEISFRPVYPLQLRYKRKWQTKRNFSKIGISESHTQENTFRIMLSHREAQSFIGIEIRTAQVNMLYGNTFGNFVSVFGRKSIGKQFEIYGNAVIYEASQMSQWILEDVGIDFLYGDGIKYLLAINERPSPDLHLKFKFIIKHSKYPSNYKELYKYFEFSIDYVF